MLPLHEVATGLSHDFEFLATTTSVQQLLSTERHSPMYTQLRAKVSVRSQNLMLASMPHASDWLLTPPIPGLGLALGSDCFRTALKFRLGMPLFREPFPCAAITSSGVVCDCQMDVYGDHALCCHNGASLLFRHNSIRDILGHTARAAGLSAVVTEKKHQVEGSNAKPGDILFNITIVASRLPLLTSPFPTHCRKNILILR